MRVFVCLLVLQFFDSKEQIFIVIYTGQPIVCFRGGDVAATSILVALISALLLMCLATVRCSSSRIRSLVVDGLLMLIMDHSEQHK